MLLELSRRDDGKVRARMSQLPPPPQSDTLGVDRVLVVTLAAPARSTDILATIQDRLDTAD